MLKSGEKGGIRRNYRIRRSISTVSGPLWRNLQRSRGFHVQAGFCRNIEVESGRIGGAHVKISNLLSTPTGVVRNLASHHASLWNLFVSFSIAFGFLSGHSIAAAELNATDFAAVAADIDLRLRETTDRAPTSVDDATFFSRVWLDLAGRRPDATDIKQFLQNNNPEKRNTLVKQLLSDSRFGRHWGRYWRDTILARRADERALQLVSDSLTEAVAQRINDNFFRDFVKNIILKHIISYATYFPQTIVAFDIHTAFLLF